MVTLTSTPNSGDILSLVPEATTGLGNSTARASSSPAAAVI